MNIGPNVLQKACLAVVLTTVVLARPGIGAPPERVYIACDDHTDYYWSGDAATYRQAFLEMIDYYQDFEATYGAKLPSYSAAFGNEWDLYPASLAEVSARVKRAIEKLRAAEALAVLVSLKNPKFMAGREAARDQAMMHMGLYFNHDWTGDGRISRDTLRDWAKGLAVQIEGYVGTLGGDASAALGRMIPPAANTRGSTSSTRSARPAQMPPISRTPARARSTRSIWPPARKRPRNGSRLTTSRCSACWPRTCRPSDIGSSRSGRGRASPSRRPPP